MHISDRVWDRIAYVFLKNFVPTPIVLVVDDDYYVRTILSMTLERRGCTVLMACNGQDALDQMREYEPDAIVSDVKMPVMGGFEFHQKVKSMYPGIAFLAMTAFTHDPEAICIRQQLGVDLLEKPFHADIWQLVTEKIFSVESFATWVLPQAWRRLRERIMVANCVYLFWFFRVIAILCTGLIAFSMLQLDGSLLGLVFTVGAVILLAESIIGLRFLRRREQRQGRS